MGIVVEDIDRRLVPRWRNSAALGSGAELASLKSSPVAVSTEAFIAKLDEWQRDRTLGVAVDLLTSAVALSRHDQAREAADFVLKNAARVSDAVLRIAHQVAGSSSALTKPQATSENLDELVSIVRRDIHQLRQLLQDHPRDALAWSDMARAYATIGQVDRALHAMEMARRLAPSSRPILRSASRLLVRAGAPDEAQALLQRSDRTRHDPWLMSAELAVALVAGKPPRFIREARRAITERQYSVSHLSELAGSVATIDLQAGDVKRARKNYRISLEAPTENAVAQVAWANRRIGGLELPDDSLQIAGTHEARTWNAMLKGDWDAALTHCMNWLLDEPFSSRPAMQGSFLACSVIPNCALGVEIAEFGLTSHPRHQGLLNNLAVCLAGVGKAEQARAAFTLITDPTHESLGEATYLATKGLLEYRAGRLVEGRTLYLEALEHAAGAQRPAVLIHLARQELLARTAAAQQYVDAAMAAARSSPRPEVKRMAELLIRDANAITSALNMSAAMPSGT